MSKPIISQVPALFQEVLQVMPLYHHNLLCNRIIVFKVTSNKIKEYLYSKELEGIKAWNRL